MNSSAHQYRLIQKRLLGRYKDKNPSPVGALELMMKETYDKILNISDKIEQGQELLILQQSELDAFSKLIVLSCTLK